MFSGIDAVGIGKNPVYEHDLAMAILFMIILFLGNFFILNLLVGVVTDHFNNESKNEKGAYVSDEQRQFALIQVYMLNQTLKYKPHIPDQPFRKICYTLVENPKFDIFIMTCIILNSALLAMNYYGISPSTVIILDRLGFVFGIIYTIEAIIKIIAYKKKYFEDTWNRFDFTIVCISIFEFIITIFVEAEWLVINTLFRIFRVGRIVKLVKSAKRLNTIFSTFILTLPAMANLGSLLLLLIYIYTILGV